MYSSEAGEMNVASLDIADGTAGSYGCFAMRYVWIYLTDFVMSFIDNHEPRNHSWHSDCLYY